MAETKAKKATTKTPTIHTYKSVWDTLSAINVEEHTEKREAAGGRTLTYLSWAWAWGIMMKHYPEMWVDFQGSQEHPDVVYYNGGTAMVRCTVSIPAVEGDVIGEHGPPIMRSCWLPVMQGYKFEAVTNPDARAISDTKMRCMVKCFALLGLGHYIYAGEDLPEMEEAKPKKTDPATADLLTSKIKKLGVTLADTGVEFDADMRADIKEAIKGKNVKKLKHIVKAMEGMMILQGDAEDGQTQNP